MRKTKTYFPLSFRMVFLHFLSACLAIAVTWFLSGKLIEAVDRVAKRYNKPGFFVAFFVLGFLTSIGEISVAVNSTLQKIPQISAGNLVGGSFVIFLLIIPLLAVAANGIEMNLAIKKRNLKLLLLVVLLPSLMLMDGAATWQDGVILILAYTTLILAIQKKDPTQEIAEEVLEEVGEELIHKHKATLYDLAKVAAGAVLIFFAGKILVDEAIYFSEFFRVPASFIGLFVLSIGTNIPELAIALRCVLQKQKHIAFGDYLGSAAANTLILGILILVNGDFSLERSQFILTFLLLLPGLVLFYFFSCSKDVLSRGEGWILLGFYLLFLISEITNLAQIIPAIPGVITGTLMRAGIL